MDVPQGYLVHIDMKKCHLLNNKTNRLYNEFLQSKVDICYCLYLIFVGSRPALNLIFQISQPIHSNCIQVQSTNTVNTESDRSDKGQ